MICGYYYSLQVVAGTRYRFTLQVGLAVSCWNDGKPGTLEQCPINKNSVSNLRCDIIIYFDHPHDFDVIHTIACNCMVDSSLLWIDLGPSQ